MSQILKAWLDNIKVIVEITAIIIAGGWTYFLFVKNRINFPYVKLEHIVNHRKLSKQNNYLNVSVRICNTGKVVVKPIIGIIYVRQVVPLNRELKELIINGDVQDVREGNVADLFHEKGTQISWREVGYRKTEWEKGEVVIEPGESDDFYYDFILPTQISTVEITSYYQNYKKRKPIGGWRLTTFYDLNP